MEEEEEDIKVEVNCMWVLSANEVRESDKQPDKWSSGFVEKIDIEFDLYDKNGMLDIITKKYYS